MLQKSSEKSKPLDTRHAKLLLAKLQPNPEQNISGRK
jgi:hypothetical protein